MRSRSSEILALTGIRAFAAYAVLLTHFHGELCALVPGFEHFAPIYTRGGLGVDLFFILSGFIISHVYQQRFQESVRRSYGPYLLNRFARIYPNYFATLLILVIMVGAGKMAGVAIQGDYPWAWLPAHFFMLQPLPGIPGGWNFPGWLIGAEFFAYILIFPLYIYCVRRFRPGAGTVMVVAPAMLLAFWIPKNLGFWGSVEHIPMVTAEFLCGALLHSACTRSSTIRSWMGRLLPVTAGLIVLVTFFSHPFSHGWDRVILVLLFAPLLCGLFTTSGWIAGFFSTPLVVYLGHTSYALYLVHAIVQKVLKATVFHAAIRSESQIVHVLVFLLYLLLPLAAASLLYHSVEEPCRKWIRTRWGK